MGDLCVVIVRVGGISGPHVGSSFAYRGLQVGGGTVAELKVTDLCTFAIEK